MDTKESILYESLKLFAQNGYEAVSVRDIAGKLGMTQAALYKHYAGKQDIFDCIVKRMNDNYAVMAEKLSMPRGSLKSMAEGYKKISLDDIKRITVAQFLYWTQDEYASCFRRMLTLEQYRNKDMSDLYQVHLASGVINYMTQLFEELIKNGRFKKRDARQMALDFYSPIYLMMSVYDASHNKEEVIEIVKSHIEQFAKNYEEGTK